MPQSDFHIILVEDDSSVRSAVAQSLRDEGYLVTPFPDGRDAIANFPPDADLVLTDLQMPHVDGRSLLRWVTQNRPGTAVILMTAFGTIPQAVDAIKAGAHAYLTKPLDPGELLVKIRQLADDKRLKSELARLRGQLREGWHYRNILGHSPPMQAVLSLIDRAAPVRTTVLITGESGTGKEMVAKALHEASPRKEKPFLAINCAAMPENLIEATLFGHERGSFTGADRAAPGYFRDAHGGTLLLDEVGELPPGVQSKLLRVLEDGMVTPVGTTTPHKVDVRIVCATNRDLESQVRQGKFRQDLFYRLNVLRIALPPLRERKEDIPLLARFFLDQICKENNLAPRQIDPSLLEAFSHHNWPGNIRELRNLLESLVILSGRPTLTAEDLPDTFFASGGSESIPEEQESQTLKTITREMIRKALDAHHGNRTEAAKQLGISRRTMHRKLNEFGLR
jgi:DNA-binding NtrC family response regulator